MFESLDRAWGRKQEPKPKAPKLGVAGEGGGRAGTPAPHCSRNWVPRVPLLPQGMARPASQLPERSALPGRRVPPPAPVRPDSQGLGLVLTNEPVSAAPGRFAGFRAPRAPRGCPGLAVSPPLPSHVCVSGRITELAALVPFDTDTFVCLSFISVFPTKSSPARGRGLHRLLSSWPVSRLPARGCPFAK